MAISSIERALSIGDRVRLTATRHGDGRTNPIWGGKMGRVIGTVDQASEIGPDGSSFLCVSVKWDSGYNNRYDPSDLSLHEKIPINVMFKGRTGTVVCKLRDYYIVNFEENVRGFSCDGKYKKGSCLIVPKIEAREVKI